MSNIIYCNIKIYDYYNFTGNAWFGKSKFAPKDLLFV